MIVTFAGRTEADPESETGETARVAMKWFLPDRRKESAMRKYVGGHLGIGSTKRLRIKAETWLFRTTPDPDDAAMEYGRFLLLQRVLTDYPFVYVIAVEDGDTTDAYPLANVHADGDAAEDDWYEAHVPFQVKCYDDIEPEQQSGGFVKTSFELLAPEVDA